jgi:hypothetical protein
VAAAPCGVTDVVAAGFALRALFVGLTKRLG